MQTKHTPGPWKFDIASNPGECFNIYGAVNTPVAAVYLSSAEADDYDDPSETDQANARLIASAPDLLAALVALVGEADLGEIDHDDDTRAMLAQARAAIARATGEA